MVSLVAAVKIGLKSRMTVNKCRVTARAVKVTQTNIGAR